MRFTGRGLTLGMQNSVTICVYTMNQANQVEYHEMSEDQKIVRTTSTKLIKHFRGLEDAGLLPEHIAANLIGCVRKLTTLAERAVDPFVVE